MKKIVANMQSLRFRLIGSVSLLLVCVFFICWLVNQIFLPAYYQYSKCKALQISYSKVAEKIQNIGYDSEEDLNQLALEKWSEDHSMSIYVLNWSSFYSSGGPDYRGIFVYPSNDKINEIDRRQIITQIAELNNTIHGREPRVKITTLRTSEQYIILKVHDERLDSDYLELIGNIEMGRFSPTVYLRTNYESIQESVQLSSDFLIYAALLALVIGVILMYVISDNFTKPIKQLCYIAHEMTELKFETRYAEKRKDEIGDLGTCINHLSQRLEHTISELKAANNALQIDIENKIQIDEMRKEFLANVSHELKTPIALIQGYAEGLQDNINDDEAGREFYCEVIIDEANKMNNMVKKLLNLNQIEFGKNQIEFERFDVVELICSILNSTQILFEQKGVTLRMLQKKPVYVWSDQYMVEEVLTNYISNALHHVEDENVIEILFEIKKENVRISVKNTGKLIPEEDLDKVWEKFYKVDKARTREYGGSGLGLSIVKAIMKSMHQQCGVRNVENGVEFWFELDICGE